ncbi:hypothetical protein Tco_1408103 [Tanacetum coccineum]
MVGVLNTLPLSEFHTISVIMLAFKAATVSEALFCLVWKVSVHSCVGQKVGQVQLTGPELVQETTERIIQIKQRIQTAHDRQNSYANLKRKPMEFQVGDKVMALHGFALERGSTNVILDDPLVVTLEGLQSRWTRLHFVESL